MSGYKIISADSQLNEPLEVYQRLPAQYRSRAPRAHAFGKEFQALARLPACGGIES